VAVRPSICAAVVTALACAPSALADTTNSTNWAGYAAHGVSYRSVQGSWVQPSATCVRGTQTYSSYWVGIGGYSATSQALEQIGTEVDCSTFGRVSSSAWYELVPAPSTPVRFTVRPGDMMQAGVSISGSAVTMSLNDVTSHQAVRKTVRASTIDLSSAEWIVEAPSECVSPNSCQTLPLANFGSATFRSSAAWSSAGRGGAITNPAWQTTRVDLRPNSRRFIVNTSSGPAIGIATPTALQPDGTAFAVNYSQILVPGGNVFQARNAAVLAGHLVHPTR
jgi:Peptidase A4 family